VAERLFALPPNAKGRTSVNDQVTFAILIFVSVASVALMGVALFMP
jgi:hypothetical protein